MTNEELIVDLQWKLKAMTERAERLQKLLRKADNDRVQAQQQVEQMRQLACEIAQRTNRIQRIAAGEKE